MASDLSFVEYVRDQMQGAGQIIFRKMFGAYLLYFDGKVVALIAVACSEEGNVKIVVRIFYNPLKSLVSGRRYATRCYF